MMGPDKFSKVFSGQFPQRLMEDMAGFAGNAMSFMHTLREEMQDFVKARVDEKVAHLDLVGREEFETVKKMAAEARAENAALRKELTALQSGKKAAPKSTSAKSPQKKGKKA